MALLVEDGLAKNELELVNQIKVLYPEIKVNEQTIKTPTTNFVVEFYKHFLNDFYVDFSAVTQINMNQGAVIESYSEMYTDIIPLINLTVAIKSFNIPALKNFCIFDLINPTPKRTLNHLIHVVHFIYFSDKRVNVLSSMLEKINDLKATRDTVIKNIENAKMTLSSQAKKTADYLSRYNETCEKIKEVDEELCKLNRENDDLMQHLGVVKSKHNTLNGDYEKITSELRMVENDIEEYVVQMEEMHQPNFVGDETMSIELLQEKSKELTEKYAEMTKTLKLKQEAYDQRTLVSKACKAMIDNAKCCTESIAGKLDLEKKREYYSNQIESLNKDIKKTETSLLLVKNDISIIKETLNEKQLQWKEVCSDLRGINNAKSEYECQKKCDKEAEIHQLKEKIQNCTFQIEENNILYEQLMLKYAEQIELQNRQVEEMFKNFENYINDVFNEEDTL